MNFFPFQHLMYGKYCLQSIPYLPHWQYEGLSCPHHSIHSKCNNHLETPPSGAQYCIDHTWAGGWDEVSEESGVSWLMDYTQYIHFRNYVHYIQGVNFPFLSHCFNSSFLTWQQNVVGSHSCSPWSWHWPLGWAGRQVQWPDPSVRHNEVETIHVCPAHSSWHTTLTDTVTDERLH